MMRSAWGLLPGCAALALGLGALVFRGGPEEALPPEAPERAAPALAGEAVLPPQVSREVDGRGLVHLRWVRPAPLVVGQPVVLRWTVVNPSEAPVMLDQDPCQALARDAQGSGGLSLGGPRVQCGEGGRMLAPGDSAWMELRGTLLSPPGQARAGEPFYPGPLDLLPGDGTGHPLPASRLQGPERVPVVVDARLPAGHPVTRGRVEALLEEVAAARDWMVVPMTRAGARAQVGEAPWVQLEITEGEGAGTLQAAGCWTHPMHGDGGCFPMRTTLQGGDPGAVLATGGPLHRFLRTILSLRDPSP